MANRFPLIFNTSANRIEELNSGDALDLTGSILLDSTGSPGSSGQVLQSTVTGTLWSNVASDVSPVVMGMIF